MFRNARRPFPPLLATSAVHHHLVKVQKRQLTALVVETGEARDVMHFATLVGYGASAINPYLAFEIIADLKEHGKLPPGLRLENAIENYITAIKKGLLKIMSKMGVSTIRRYRGAQIFEAMGLNADFINAYFCGTPSRIGGIGAAEIARETLARHADALCKDRGGRSRRSIPAGQIHFRALFRKAPAFSRSGHAPAAGRARKRLWHLQKVLRRDQRRPQKPLHPARAFPL